MISHSNFVESRAIQNGRLVKQVGNTITKLREDARSLSWNHPDMKVRLVAEFVASLLAGQRKEVVPELQRSLQVLAQGRDPRLHNLRHFARGFVDLTFPGVVNGGAALRTIETLGNCTERERASVEDIILSATALYERAQRAASEKEKQIIIQTLRKFRRAWGSAAAPVLLSLEALGTPEACQELGWYIVYGPETRWHRGLDGAPLLAADSLLRLLDSSKADLDETTTIFTLAWFSHRESRPLRDALRKLLGEYWEQRVTTQL